MDEFFFSFADTVHFINMKKSENAYLKIGQNHKVD